VTAAGRRNASYTPTKISTAGTPAADAMIVTFPEAVTQAEVAARIREMRKYATDIARKHNGDTRTRRWRISLADRVKFESAPNAMVHSFTLVEVRSTMALL